MYFLLKMGIFQCHVSFQGCNPTVFFLSIFLPQKKTVEGGARWSFFAPWPRFAPQHPRRCVNTWKESCTNSSLQKTLGCKQIKELFGTVGCVCFLVDFFFSSFLDGKSLFSDIRRWGRGSSQSTSPKSQGFWWLILCLIPRAKQLLRGESDMNLLKTNGWNPTSGGS